MTCSTHANIPAGTAIAVSVNGVAIARDEIVREMQHHPADKPVAAWQKAARALVVRELLLQRARQMDLAAEPLNDAEGRRETDEEAVIRALIEREVTLPEPDNDACRRYYERNPARFRSPDIYEVSHILFAALPSDSEAYAQACKAAAAAMTELRAHPERFATLAQAHSCCPSAAQGGNLGQITGGQTTPEFERALLALTPGEMSPQPVETRYGFHVIRLDRRHDGRLLPYEVVADRIADYLRESVRRRAQAQYIARLVSAARIEGVELADSEALRVH